MRWRADSFEMLDKVSFFLFPLFNSGIVVHQSFHFFFFFLNFWIEYPFREFICFLNLIQCDELLAILCLFNSIESFLFQKDTLMMLVSNNFMPIISELFDAVLSMYRVSHFFTHIYQTIV